MSVPTDEQQQQDAGAEAPARTLIPVPDRAPRLPVVQFRSEKPRLRVFFSANDAEQAAQACRGDEFFDVRGIVLRCGDGEPSRLEANDEGDPDGLQQRLVDHLRAAADEVAASDGSDADEIEAFLDWLAQAPSLEFAVRGLGFSEVDYGIPDAAARAAAGIPRSVESRWCHHCSWWEKLWGASHCCP